MSSAIFIGFENTVEWRRKAECFLNTKMRQTVRNRAKINVFVARHSLTCKTILNTGQSVLASYSTPLQYLRMRVSSHPALHRHHQQ